MPTVEGFEVLEIEPHFANPPRMTPFREHTVFEMSPAAKRILQFKGASVLHRLHHEFLFNNRADFGELADFFFDRKGKWSGFWVPSWHEELKPVAAITATDSTLSIDPVDYAAVYLAGAGAPVTKLGNYLWLYHEDGSIEYLKVTGATAADPEVLTLDASTPIAKSAGLGAFVLGFLYFVRFVGDELPFRFFHESGSRLSVSFVEVTRYSGEADAVAASVIYEFFDGYAVGEVVAPSALTGGLGWESLTAINPNRMASVARDFWEGYAVGVIVGADIDAGVGWADVAFVAVNQLASVALDTFESYSVGTVFGSDITNGTGWSGAASIAVNS